MASLVQFLLQGNKGDGIHYDESRQYLKIDLTRGTLCLSCNYSSIVG